jgi:hypothetical protein
MSKKTLALSLCLLACLVLVPTLLSYHRGFQDYFQDWASARNWWEGIAVYSPHRETVKRYLGTDFVDLPNGKMYRIVATVQVNAHPPSSVLFYLPFALLPYGISFFAWNFASTVFLALALGIISHELEIKPAPALLLCLAPIGLMRGALFEQMFFGQSNTLILALLALAWQAHRKGWQSWEGCWLGIAIAFKFFPAVLLMIPLASKRWRCLFAAVSTALALGLLAVVLFGPEIWQEYVALGVPEARLWGDLWPNASLAAFWRKLFVSQNKGVPVTAWPSPLAFWLSYVVSSAVVTLATAWLAVRRGRTSSSHTVYAAGVCTMLLLSPTCWPHYFVMLLLPTFILWRESAGDVYRQGVLIVCFLVLALPFHHCWRFWPSEHGSKVIDPAGVLTVLALQTYALGAMWLIAISREIREATLALRIAIRRKGPPFQKIRAAQLQ